MNISPSLDKTLLTCLMFTESPTSFVAHIETLSSPYCNINSIPELLESLNPSINWQVMHGAYNPEAPLFISPLLTFTTLFKFHFVYDFAQQILEAFKEEHPTTILLLPKFIEIFTEFLESYTLEMTPEEFSQNYPLISLDIFSYLIAASKSLIKDSSLPRELLHAPVI